MSAQGKKSAAETPGSGMSDAELMNVHDDLKREKHPPTANFLRAPLVFVFLFGCLVFACAIQLAHTTNSPNKSYTGVCSGVTYSQYGRENFVAKDTNVQIILNRIIGN